MKICIYGAGAIGGYMGLLLKAGGADVSLVARGEHLAAIKENGVKLLIDGAEKTARMPATDNPAELGPQDFVIIALKSHQAWEAAEHMKPLLGANTAVVTAQNGVPWWYFHGLPGQYENLRLESVDPGERQWRAIGPERVIGCTVYPATEVVSPGVIKHVYGNAFGLGEPNRKETERLKRLAEAFEKAGMKPRVYPEIRNDIWLKLWGNLCFNPISAITRGTLDIIASDPGTRMVARNMMAEAERIGRRLGVHFRVDIERRINGAAKCRRAPHIDAARPRSRTPARAGRAAFRRAGDGAHRRSRYAVYRHGARLDAANGPHRRRLPDLPGIRHPDGCRDDRGRLGAPSEPIGPPTRRPCGICRDPAIPSPRQAVRGCFVCRGGNASSSGYGRSRARLRSRTRHRHSASRR